MDEAAPFDPFAISDRLFECIEHKACMRRAADPPADDAARKGIGDECDVDEAGPGGDVRKVRDPQHVRPVGAKLPVDVIERAWRGLVWNRRAPDLAADHPLQTQGFHHPFHCATRHLEANPLELPPDLVRAIDVAVAKHRQR